MPTPLPIACKLDASALSARLAEMSAVGASAGLGAEVCGRRAAVRFRSDEHARRRIEALVDAESECCPFLTMGLADDGRELVLTVEGPQGAEPVIAELARAFTPR